MQLLAIYPGAIAGVVVLWVVATGDGRRATGETSLSQILYDVNAFADRHLRDVPAGYVATSGPCPVVEGPAPCERPQVPASQLVDMIVRDVRTMCLVLLALSAAILLRAHPGRQFLGLPASRRPG